MDVTCHKIPHSHQTKIRSWNAEQWSDTGKYSPSVFSSLPYVLKPIICKMLSRRRGFDRVKLFLHPGRRKILKATYLGRIMPAAESAPSPRISFENLPLPHSYTCYLDELDTHKRMKTQHPILRQNDYFRNSQPVTGKKCREIFTEASRKAKLSLFCWNWI